MDSLQTCSFLQRRQGSRDDGRKCVDASVEEGLLKADERRSDPNEDSKLK